MASTSHRIFILRHADEMRHPYETALKSYCSGIDWFTALGEMLKAAAQMQPSSVIVDLDTLPRPLQSSLEQIRSAFSQSDLIAIATEDSAKIAIQCIHSGFSDFLIKPTSPEELAWCLRKSSQRQAMYEKLDDPRSGMLRAAAQVSSSASPTLVRLNTLEYLQKLLHAQGAAWISRNPQTKEFENVLCALPRDQSPHRVLRLVPQKWKKRSLDEIKAYRDRNEKRRKLIIPCQTYPNEALLLWGIPAGIASQQRSDARFLVEHSELSLINLQRFDEIKQQTFVDDLTGLYNSRYLKFALTNAVLKCKQPHHSFSVLFIDVDHFKQINDKYGHLVGSQFLVTIGRTIRNAVRSIDPVFRYGGDEFVVILHDNTTEGAKEIAERIRKNIERRIFVLGGHRIHTTVSIGLATYPEHASDYETLLKLADEAMYSAKKDSRNAVHLAYGLPATPAKTKHAG